MFLTQDHHSVEGQILLPIIQTFITEEAFLFLWKFLLMGIEQQGALQSRSRSMWKGAGPILLQMDREKKKDGCVWQKSD